VVRIADDIVTRFQDSLQPKNETVEILKELFDKTKIGMISELRPDEIKLITRIRAIAELKDIKHWNTVTDWFMLLMLSNSRKSRKELIEAIRRIETEKMLNKQASNMMGMR